MGSCEVESTLIFDLRCTQTRAALTGLTLRWACVCITHRAAVRFFAQPRPRKLEKKHGERTHYTVVNRTTKVELPVLRHRAMSRQKLQLCSQSHLSHLQQLNTSNRAAKESLKHRLRSFLQDGLGEGFPLHVATPR